MVTRRSMAILVTLVFAVALNLFAAIAFADKSMAGRMLFIVLVGMVSALAGIMLTLLFPDHWFSD